MSSQTGTYTQVSKLVGTGAIGNAYQGISVKLSEDGNFLFDNTDIGAVWFYQKIVGVWSLRQKIVPTGSSGTPVGFGYSIAVNPSMTTLIVGAPVDSVSIGASFVFTYDGFTWTQHSKLVGYGVTGTWGSQQGLAVALSDDANYVIVGGPLDGNQVGATWIFARVGSAWSQQVSKLVANDYSGSLVYQGNAVAITPAGNVAVVGGYGDSSSAGAMWVFLRSGIAWIQNGPKITANGSPSFGLSLALSGNDVTLVVGGNGAAWIFKRNGNTFTQFGNALIGSGATSTARQGYSVAVNKLGTLVAVGAPYDSTSTGALFVFYFDGTNYNQLGNKIVAPDASSQAYQGVSVSLDGLGSQLLFGGYNDNGGIGAAWIYINAAITYSPSAAPTAPTMYPTKSPTTRPSVVPTTQPSVIPTTQPSIVPTTRPSVVPTTRPSVGPTTQPSVEPTTRPSVVPTIRPSVVPTTQPSVVPTTEPSVVPTTRPSVGLTTQPSLGSTTQLSIVPTTQPSVGPTTWPSVFPTTEPSLSPLQANSSSNEMFLDLPLMTSVILLVLLFLCICVILGFCFAWRKLKGFQNRTDAMEIMTWITHSDNKADIRFSHKGVDKSFDDTNPMRVPTAQSDETVRYKYAEEL